MQHVFHYEKKENGVEYTVEAELFIKRADVFNDVSDWDNRGYIDILDVKVYHNQTNEDVSDTVGVSDKEVLREWEIYVDTQLLGE